MSAYSKYSKMKITSDGEPVIDGCTLGWKEGCDVGQKEIDGFIEGWLLGVLLTDGDAEYSDEGLSVTDGTSLGWLLGEDEG